MVIFGSQGYGPGDAKRLADQYGLPRQIAQHLVETYGDRADDVLQLSPLATAANEANKSWDSERLVTDFPYLRCEVIYATRREWAATPEVCLLPAPQRASRARFVCFPAHTPRWLPRELSGHHCASLPPRLPGPSGRA